ncbi:hypothetical protein Rhe02_02340 [Rhizocola hellebori]|uniref:Uncharacterized protein n=1 Tax=Rhizocola hellebori TaxID=1392758 RepID=A0A8J3Q2F8_9ACTN|nr:hypothetical protein [Rhizocola hellebori]GIH02167.1 hypothetical protein Rhe02_02340 [Rhizocola hellebori]
MKITVWKRTLVTNEVGGGSGSGSGSSTGRDDTAKQGTAAASTTPAPVSPMSEN